MSNMIELYCWVLGYGPDELCPILVEKSKTVADLKVVIKAENPHALRIDARKLALWKLSMAEKEVYAYLEHIDPDSLKDSDKLRSLHHLSQVFPDPPEDGHIYLIVVQQSYTISLSSSNDFKLSDTSLLSKGSAPVKRTRSSSIDIEEVKKRRIDVNGMLPSEAGLNLLHKRLQRINPDPNWYSNPQNINRFPFPFVYNQLPIDRFDLSDPPESVFEYMGRVSFTEVWNKVTKLKVRGGYTRLYIQGTMGYVYLDCRELLGDMSFYFQSALLCAFADPSLSDSRDEIRACKSQDDITNFCRAQEALYFIVDQKNALETGGSNIDTVTNSTKEATQRFLSQITATHYTITSVSANYGTALHMAKKQSGDQKMLLMGGMSEVEMKWWWFHHKAKTPIVDDDDKARVEDLTGRIPLLLRPLLEWANKPFHDIEEKFWAHPDLAVVGENIQAFSAAKLEVDINSNYEKFYLRALRGCLTGTGVQGITYGWFDFRYFWPSNGVGNYTCGLAREAAATVLRQGKPGMLCSNEWFKAFEGFKNNPCVMGFLVEQACLSHISQTGFHHGDLDWESFAATIFDNDIFQSIPLDWEGEQFFIPGNPYFKNVDALYLKVDSTEKTALIVPIQITIAKKHKDSETLFYSGWCDWEEHFQGYQLSSTFVWIVEDEQSWRIVDAEFRSTRSGNKQVLPTHVQTFITVNDLYPHLGNVLALVRMRLT